MKSQKCKQKQAEIFGICFHIMASSFHSQLLGLTSIFLITLLDKKWERVNYNGEKWPLVFHILIY